MEKVEEKTSHGSTDPSDVHPHTSAPVPGLAALPKFTPGSNGGPKRIIKKITYIDPQKIKQLGLEQKIAEAVSKLKEKTLASLQNKSSGGGPSKNESSSAICKLKVFLSAKASTSNGALKKPKSIPKAEASPSKPSTSSQGPAKIFKSIKKAQQKLSASSSSGSKTAVKSESLENKNASETETKKKRGRPRKNPPNVESEELRRETMDQLTTAKPKSRTHLQAVEVSTEKCKGPEKSQSPLNKEFCGFSAREVDTEEKSLRRLSKLIDDKDMKGNSNEIKKIPSFSNLRTYLQLKRVQNEGSENSCDSIDVGKETVNKKEQNLLPTDEKLATKKLQRKKPVPVSVLKVTKKKSSKGGIINELKSKTGIDLFLSSTVLKDKEVITEDNKKEDEEVNASQDSNSEKSRSPGSKNPRTVVLKVLNRDPQSGKVEVELIDPLIKAEKVQAVVTDSTLNLPTVEKGVADENAKLLDAASEVEEVDKNAPESQNSDLECSGDYNAPLSPRALSMSSEDREHEASPEIEKASDHTSPNKSPEQQVSKQPAYRTIKTIQDVTRKLSFSEPSISKPTAELAGPSGSSISISSKSETSADNLSIEKVSAPKATIKTKKVSFGDVPSGEDTIPRMTLPKESLTITPPNAGNNQTDKLLLSPVYNICKQMSEKFSSSSQSKQKVVIMEDTKKKRNIVVMGIRKDVKVCSRKDSILSSVVHSSDKTKKEPESTLNRKQLSPAKNTPTRNRTTSLKTDSRPKKVSRSNSTPQRVVSTSLKESLPPKNSPKLSNKTQRRRTSNFKEGDSPLQTKSPAEKKSKSPKVGGKNDSPKAYTSTPSINKTGRKELSSSKSDKTKYSFNFDHLFKKKRPKSTAFNPADTSLVPLPSELLEPPDDNIEQELNEYLEDPNPEDAVDFLLSYGQVLSNEVSEESFSSDCESVTLENFDYLFDNALPVKNEVDGTTVVPIEDSLKQENLTASPSKETVHQALNTEVVYESALNEEDDNASILDDSSDEQSPEYELLTIEPVPALKDEDEEELNGDGAGQGDHYDTEVLDEKLQESEDETSRPIVIEHKILSDQEKINICSIGNAGHSSNSTESSPSAPPQSEETQIDQTLIMEEDLQTQEEIELMTTLESPHNYSVVLGEVSPKSIMPGEEVEDYLIDDTEVYLLQDEESTQDTPNECHMLGKVFRLNENNEIEVIHNVGLSAIRMAGNRRKSDGKSSEEVFDLADGTEIDGQKSKEHRSEELVQILDEETKKKSSQDVIDSVENISAETDYAVFESDGNLRNLTFEEQLLEKSGSQTRISELSDNKRGARKKFKPVLNLRNLKLDDLNESLTASQDCDNKKSVKVISNVHKADNKDTSVNISILEKVHYVKEDTMNEIVQKDKNDNDSVQNAADVHISETLPASSAKPQEVKLESVVAKLQKKKSVSGEAEAEQNISVDKASKAKKPDSIQDVIPTLKVKGKVGRPRKRIEIDDSVTPSSGKLRIEEIRKDDSLNEIVQNYKNDNKSVPNDVDVHKSEIPPASSATTQEVMLEIVVTKLQRKQSVSGAVESEKYISVDKAFQATKSDNIQDVIPTPKIKGKVGRPRKRIEVDDSTTPSSGKPKMEQKRKDESINEIVQKGKNYNKSVPNDADVHKTEILPASSAKTQEVKLESVVTKCQKMQPVSGAVEAEKCISVDKVSKAEKSDNIQDVIPTPKVKGKVGRPRKRIEVDASATQSPGKPKMEQNQIVQKDKNYNQSVQNDADVHKSEILLASSAKTQEVKLEGVAAKLQKKQSVSREQDIQDSNKQQHVKTSDNINDDTPTPKVKGKVGRPRKRIQVDGSDTQSSSKQKMEEKPKDESEILPNRIADFDEDRKLVNKRKRGPKIKIDLFEDDSIIDLPVQGDHKIKDHLLDNTSYKQSIPCDQTQPIDSSSEQPNIILRIKKDKKPRKSQIVYLRESLSPPSKRMKIEPEEISGHPKPEEISGTPKADPEKIAPKTETTPLVVPKKRGRPRKSSVTTTPVSTPEPPKAIEIIEVTRSGRKVKLTEKRRGSGLFVELYSKRKHTKKALKIDTLKYENLEESDRVSDMEFDDDVKSPELIPKDHLKPKRKHAKKKIESDGISDIDIDNDAIRDDPEQLSKAGLKPKCNLDDLLRHDDIEDSERVGNGGIDNNAKDDQEPISKIYLKPKHQHHDTLTYKIIKESERVSDLDIDEDTRADTRRVAKRDLKPKHIDDDANNDPEPISKIYLKPKHEHNDSLTYEIVKESDRVSDINNSNAARDQAESISLADLEAERKLVDSFTYDNINEKDKIIAVNDGGRARDEPESISKVNLELKPRHTKREVNIDPSTNENIQKSDRDSDMDIDDSVSDNPVAISNISINKIDDEIIPSPSKKAYKRIRTVSSDSESDKNLSLAAIANKIKNKNIEQETPKQVKKRGRKKKLKTEELQPKMEQSACTTEISRGKFTPNRVGRKRKSEYQIKMHPKLLLISNRKDLYKEDERIPAPLNPGEIRCGFCKEATKKALWRKHIESHYYIGWKEGEMPIDVADYRAVLCAMNYAMKVYNVKVHECKLCGMPLKSAAGILYHIETCQASEEEKEKMRYVCICGKNIPTQLSTLPHMKHCPRDKKVEEIEKSEKPEKLEDNESSMPLKKRKAVLKAEKLMKESLAEDHDNNEDDFVKPFIEKANSVMIKWKARLKKYGEGKCVSTNCNFTALNIPELVAHHKICDKILKSGYTCTRCQFIATDKNEVVEHARAQHIRKEIIKDFEGSDSEAEIENESSESEGSSGVDENEDQQPKIKRGDWRKGVGVGVAEKWKKIYNAHTGYKFRKEAEQWTREFQNDNYSDQPLFTYAIPKVTLLDPSNYTDYSPNNSYSMKFSYTCKDKFNKAFGSSVKPEIWNELEVFESEILFGDIMTFIGGPVSSLAWIPTKDYQTLTQYLAVTYKKDLNQYVHQVNPEKQKICMLIYEIGTYDSIKEKVPPKILYGIPFDSGPVLDIKFLPSGGYAPELNRLGLVAVATTETNVNIYSLPLKAPYNCDRTISFPLLVIKPTIVLSLDILKRDLKYSLLLDAQCSSIAWSKFKGHTQIAGAFYNGFISIWDISEDDNLNCLEERCVRRYVPTNYFHVTNNRLACVDFHYDESGPRWLIASSENREIKIYDLRDVTPASILTSDQIRSNANSVDWPIYWENAVVSQSDELQKGFATVSTFCPMNIPYRMRRAIKIATGALSVSFNVWQNSCVVGCVNGDLSVFHCYEWRHDVCSVSSFDDKYLSYTDMIQLDGADILNKISQKGDEKEHIELFDSNYKHKYGLILSHLKKCRNETGDTSRARDPSFNLNQYVKINHVASNPNEYGHEFHAAGYENGLVRIFLFNTSGNKISRKQESKSYQLAV